MQPLRLTTEEIEAIYATGPQATVALVHQLLTQVEQLTQQVADLQERLGRNSRNSHQPPSSDGFNKPPRSLRQRTGKRPGGQAGHRGNTLRFNAQPDAVVRHRPSHCQACGLLRRRQPLVAACGRYDQADALLCASLARLQG